LPLLLRRAPVEGTEQLIPTPTRASDPSWAPDGSALVCNSFDDDRIYTVDLSSGQAQALSEAEWMPPHWSPFLGPPPPDTPPSVTLTSPAEGQTVSGVVNLQADATDDHGVAQVEFFIAQGSVGVDTDASDGWAVSWDSNTVQDGSHTAEAVATDTTGQTGSDAHAFSVNNSQGASKMYVAAIDWSKTGPHLAITVTVRSDSGAAVEGATVAMDLTRAEGGSWSFTGTTNSAGQVEFMHKRAASGAYTATVTNITHGAYEYDPALDIDNPDQWTL